MLKLSSQINEDNNFVLVFKFIFQLTRATKHTISVMVWLVHKCRDFKYFKCFCYSFIFFNFELSHLFFLYINTRNRYLHVFDELNYGIRDLVVKV